MKECLMFIRMRTRGLRRAFAAVAPINSNARCESINQQRFRFTIRRGITINTKYFDDDAVPFQTPGAIPATFVSVRARSENRLVAPWFSPYVPKNSAFPGMKKADRSESRSIIPSRMTHRRREVRETPFERE